MAVRWIELTRAKRSARSVRRIGLTGSVAWDGRKRGGASKLPITYYGSAWDALPLKRLGTLQVPLCLVWVGKKRKVVWAGLG